MKPILLLLFLSTITLFAKEFNLIIHKPFDGALFDITQDYDRTISAVGVSKEFQQHATYSRSYDNAFDYLESISQKYGSQMHLLKVDSQSAQIIFSKTAKLTKFNTAVSLKKSATNGYFVGGYTMDGSLIVAKLDANGNLLRSEYFGTKNFDRMSKLISLSDGGVLAIGSSITSRNTQDDMFTTGLGNNDIFITRFDKDLHMLWSKKYGTQYDDVGIDGVEAYDGSIVIVSTTSYDKHKDVSLMRITENGDRVWLKHYKSQKRIVPTKIIRTRDNNFVLSLVQYNDARKEHIRLIKFDLYKNVLIDKEIFTTYPSGLNDIAEFSNGSFIAVGYVKDTFNTDALAMLLNADFTMLKQEHYGDENYDIFNALSILNNSQVAVAGIHTDKNSQEANMWIVKLNKDATMATSTNLLSGKTKTTQTNTLSFYEKLLQLFEQEIKNKQLHINKDLTIEFINDALYFQAGQYHLTSKQKEFLNSFVHKLIPFLLQYKNSIKTLEINGHTSSEWGNTQLPAKYLNNEKLSMQRALSVINYIFTQQDTTTQQWLTQIMKGSGVAYKENIMQHKKEMKKDSRRVTFKIILE